MKRLSQDRIILRGVEKAVELFLPYGKSRANTSPPPDWTSDPTTHLYSELLAGWFHLNKHLFGDRLRPCIITLRCGRHAAGYYAQQRFQTRDGTIIVDEIALNPEIFHAQSVTDVFSTVAHEAVHALQFQYGHPSDGGYHNKEWADWMELIGHTFPYREGGRSKDRRAYVSLHPAGWAVRTGLCRPHRARHRHFFRRSLGGDDEGRSRSRSRTR